MTTEAAKSEFLRTLNAQPSDRMWAGVGWAACEERYRPLVEALLDAWVDYPAGHDEIFNPPAAVKAMHKAVADLVDLADCTDRIFRPLTGEGDGVVHGVVHGNSAFEELLAAAEAYLEPSGSSIRAPKLKRLRAAIDRAREGAGNDD